MTYIELTQYFECGGWGYDHHVGLWLAAVLMEVE